MNHPAFAAYVEPDIDEAVSSGDIADALQDAAEQEGGNFDVALDGARTKSFRATGNDGFVLRLSNGQEFQITVVRSR